MNQTNGRPPVAALMPEVDAAEGAAPSDAVGLVIGTPGQPATPLDFWLYVDPARTLQLDDVVHVANQLPEGGEVDLYGIVDELRAVHEGVSFDSDVRLVTGGILPADTAVTAHVAVTRIAPEIYAPPLPGRAAVRARGAARDRALSFDRMERRVPLGVSRAGEPIVGNLEFLDGRRGAHVNISGVSGVATKTSYAVFLLHALFRGEALGALAPNARALVFNVKGEDLLFLDRPGAPLDATDRERYAELGLPAEPFRSVAYFAPTRRGEQLIPDTGSRLEGVTGFLWTLRDFCARRYLRFLFADADDERTQLGTVIDAVERQLAMAARLSLPVEGPGIDIAGEHIEDFEALVEAIAQQTDEAEGGTWARRAAPATVQAFLRRLEASIPHVGHLLRGDAGAGAARHRIDWSREQVTVVDLHRLHDRAQRFVVGALLQGVLEERERLSAAGEAPPVFVVLDELNKYAPREGRSPIKERILDIAERGRSLGMILIGAQQTASEVEPRVVANCAFRVVGRLDAAEAQRSEYGFLTQAARARAHLLTPGTMIVQQPEIPVPLLLQFPRPAWATRPSEVAPEASDPFARFSDSGVTQ